MFILAGLYHSLTLDTNSLGFNSQFIIELISPLDGMLTTLNI